MTGREHGPMRFSITLQGAHPPAELLLIARTVEEAGFEGLWLTDSSLHARDCWTLLGYLAANTDTLRLGTAVTHPRTRHPALAAIAAATLDEYSDGRAVLGVGAGDRPVTELGRAPARVAEVEEMIRVCRALMRGERLDVDDPFVVHGAFRKIPSRPEVPVWIAASGPRMLAMGGGTADGVLALVGTSEPCIALAVEDIDRGARAAGRPRPEIAVMGYGAISDDGVAARNASRTMAAWFAQTAPRYCDAAGIDPDLVARIRAAYRGGEFTEATEAAELCPPDMVEELTLSGTPSDVAARLDILAAAGVEHVNYFAIGPDRLSSLLAFCEVVRARRTPQPA